MQNITPKWVEINSGIGILILTFDLTEQLILQDSFFFKKYLVKIKSNKRMNAPSELKSTNCDLFFTIESIERVAIAISFFFFFPLTPLFTLKPFRNITSLHFNARFEGIHKLLRNFMQLFLVIKIFLKSIHYKRHAF